MDQFRTNLRRLRADRTAAALLQAVTPFLKDDDGHERHDAYSAMLKILHDAGAEIITDYDRAAAGLPSRGPDGWTVEELVALERHRLEALSKPLVMPVFMADGAMPKTPKGE